MMFSRFRPFEPHFHINLFLIKGLVVVVAVGIISHFASFSVIPRLMVYDFSLFTFLLL